jgi:hypothetical protein
MSFACGDEVPQISTRKPRPRLSEFLTPSAKRLSQHYRGEAAVGLRCRWRRPRLQSQAATARNPRYRQGMPPHSRPTVPGAFIARSSQTFPARATCAIDMRAAGRRSQKAITCFCPCSGRIRIQANVVFCRCPISDEDGSSSPAYDYFWVRALHCLRGRQHGITRSGSRSIPGAALPDRRRTAWKA